MLIILVVAIITIALLLYYNMNTNTNTNDVDVISDRNLSESMLIQPQCKDYLPFMQNCIDLITALSAIIVYNENGIDQKERDELIYKSIGYLYPGKSKDELPTFILEQVNNKASDLRVQYRLLYNTVFMGIPTGCEDTVNGMNKLIGIIQAMLETIGDAELIDRDKKIVAVLKRFYPTWSDQEIIDKFRMVIKDSLDQKK